MKSHAFNTHKQKARKKQKLQKAKAGTLKMLLRLHMGQRLNRLLMLRSKFLKLSRY